MQHLKIVIRLVVSVLNQQAAIGGAVVVLVGRRFPMIKEGQEGERRQNFQPAMNRHKGP